MPQQLTDQEIFDKVLVHLREQGKRATLEKAGCAYRGDKGAMCAIGCLIPDHLYDPRIENRTIDSINIESGLDVFHDILFRAGLHGDAKRYLLLSHLQHAHDFALGHSLDVWELEMQRIADQYSLTYTEFGYD